jgi:glycerophosphoryl diester phosphodiesterase
MLIIGHRGAAGLGSENTLSSLQQAEENKVDMVEADLRQTKDGAIVLAHDPSLARTHDDRRLIKQLTLSELKEIGQRENREIPTLEQFLSQAKTDINLELKESGMESLVLSAIKNFPHKVLISSGNPLVLKKIKALDGNIPLGFIIGPRWGHMLLLAIQIAKRLNPDSIHPHHSIVTPRTMSLFKAITPKVYAWTVNDKHEFEILKGLGVSGVFTDYPNIISK